MDRKNSEQVRPPNSIKPEYLQPLSMPSENNAQAGSRDTHNTNGSSNTYSDKDLNSAPNSSNPINPLTLNPNATVFIPKNFLQYKPEEPLNTDCINDEMILPMQTLKSFLTEVYYNPAHFQSHVDQLTNLIDHHVTDPNQYPHIVNTIFDETIMQSNLWYSGAKLCAILCQKLKHGNSFQDNIIERCRKKMEQIRNEDCDEGYLRCFSMFWAELYAQLENSNGIRIEYLKTEMLSLCSIMLEKTSGDNLKCLAKILKMVGVYMLDQESSMRKINDLVDNLYHLSMDESYSRDVKDLAKSVVRLKDSNWGRCISPPPSNNIEHLEQAIQDLVVDDEPVYYGPDGQPFTAEERLFLQNNLPSEFDNDDGDNYYDDDGLDDEMAQAYEDFLRETGQ